MFQHLLVAASLLNAQADMNWGTNSAEGLNLLETPQQRHYINDLRQEIGLLDQEIALKKQKEEQKEEQEKAQRNATQEKVKNGNATHSSKHNLDDTLNLLETPQQQQYVNYLRREEDLLKQEIAMKQQKEEQKEKAAKAAALKRTKEEQKQKAASKAAALNKTDMTQKEKSAKASALNQTKEEQKEKSAQAKTSKKAHSAETNSSKHTLNLLEDTPKEEHKVAAELKKEEKEAGSSVMSIVKELNGQSVRAKGSGQNHVVSATLNLLEKGRSSKLTNEEHKVAAELNEEEEKAGRHVMSIVKELHEQSANGNNNGQNHAGQTLNLIEKPTPEVANFLEKSTFSTQSAGEDKEELEEHKVAAELKEEEKEAGSHVMSIVKELHDAKAKSSNHAVNLVGNQSMFTWSVLTSVTCMCFVFFMKRKRRTVHLSERLLG